MSSPKLWRGQTLEDRSRDRREQLLDAGAELLGEGGASAVTMRAVIRRVNLSPRYFYETFDSREDFLVAVYDRVEVQLFERMRSVRIEDGLRTAIRSIFEICADFFEEEPGRARVLLREPLADDVLRRHSSDRAPAFIRMVIPLLGTEAGAMVPDDEQALAIAAAALGGALVSLYVAWIDGQLAVDRERLADAAVDLVFAVSGASGNRG